MSYYCRECQNDSNFYRTDTKHITWKVDQDGEDIECLDDLCDAMEDNWDLGEVQCGNCDRELEEDVGEDDDDD